MDPEGSGSSPSPPHGDSTGPLLRFLVAGGVLVGLTVFASLQCASDPEYTRTYPSRSLPPEPEQTILTAAGPDESYFPCSDCHEDEPVNRKVRALEDDHEDIVLEHADLWCLHCHDADDRDRLHLADGKQVRFEESWKLCVQCHGEKRESWLAGVHGKRVGNWWGPRDVWTCVSCHRPHTPHFEPRVPRPPPRRPEQIMLRKPSRSEEADHE